LYTTAFERTFAAWLHERIAADKLRLAAQPPTVSVCERRGLVTLSNIDAMSLLSWVYCVRGLVSALAHQGLALRHLFRGTTQGRRLHF
jgi:hypothetical protein